MPASKDWTEFVQSFAYGACLGTPRPGAEEVDAIIDKSGSTVSAEIHGYVSLVQYYS